VRGVQGGTEQLEAAKDALLEVSCARRPRVTEQLEVNGARRPMSPSSWRLQNKRGLK